VIAGAESFRDNTYPARLELCTTVDYTSNDDPSVTECGLAETPFETVDRLVQEVFDAVFGTVNPLLSAYVDPVLCPRLAALAPGVPGVVDIDPTGDTTVSGYGLVWDCPPYEET
jgi:hypothetical protein